MKSFEYVIKDEVGIHARPAGEIAKAAKAYQSKIVLACNGKNAEVTRLIAVMALGVKQGMTVTVTVEGEDEEVAFEGMKKLFEENL